MLTILAFLFTFRPNKSGFKQKKSSQSPNRLDLVTFFLSLLPIYSKGVPKIKFGAFN